MWSTLKNNTLRKRQQGSVAIEFSIVFTLLFATFWAIVSYALPFFMYQTMNHAVAEAAREIVRYEAPTEALAKAELKAQLEKFLPVTFTNTLENSYYAKIDNTALVGTIIEKDAGGKDVSNSYSATYRILTIRVTYPGCNATTLSASCIAPALNLLGASIPNLKPYTAETQIRLSRGN